MNDISEVGDKFKSRKVIAVVKKFVQDPRFM